MFNHALVIDPSPADSSAIKSRLTSLGIRQVLFAGRCSIGVAEINIKRKVPIDLIVLDVNQPDTRDIDSVIKVRAEKSIIKIPLIVLYSSVDSSVMFPSLAAGADECVTKEVFNSNKMKLVLVSALERRRVRLRLREQKRTKFWSKLR